MRITLLALSALSLSAPAVVQATETTPAPAGATAKPKKICRPLPARTGSHRPQGRVCKTAEEWRIRDRDVYMQGPLEDTTKVEPAGPKI